MATVEQIREAMHAQPYVPFKLHLVDGRSYTVKHPDFIAVPSSPRGRNVTVHDDAGSHMLDLNLIVEVHAQPPATTGPTANP